MGFHAGSNKQNDLSTRLTTHVTTQYDGCREKAREDFTRLSDCWIEISQTTSFRKQILDFVCLEEMLAIEVDGGQHQERLTEDNIRSKVSEEAGFRVIRFWNHEVLLEFDAVAEQILQEVLQKKPHPHPAPLLEGEGTKAYDDNFQANMLRGK